MAAKKSLVLPLDDDPLSEEAIQTSLETEFSVLSPEEIREARAEAKKRITADAKKMARNAIIEAEVERARLRTGDGYMDEEILIIVDLPPFTDRLVVDGMIFFHNHPYKRPRHVVNSLREMIARAWDHEADIKGESLRQKIGQYRANNLDKITGSRSISAREFA